MIKPLELVHSAFRYMCESMERKEGVLLDKDWVHHEHDRTMDHPLGGVRITVHPEVNEWCQENLPGEKMSLWVYSEPRRSSLWADKFYIVAFDDPNAAVLFKLRWG